MFDENIVCHLVIIKSDVLDCVQFSLQSYMNACHERAYVIFITLAWFQRYIFNIWNVKVVILYLNNNLQNSYKEIKEQPFMLQQFFIIPVSLEQPLWCNCQNVFPRRQKIVGSVASLGTIKLVFVAAFSSKSRD